MFINWFNDELQRDNFIQLWLTKTHFGIQLYKDHFIFNFFYVCLFIKFKKNNDWFNDDNNLFYFSIQDHLFTVKIKNKYLINKHLPTGNHHLCWNVLDPICKRIVFASSGKFFEYYDSMKAFELENSKIFKLTYKCKNEILQTLVRANYKQGVWYRPIFFGYFKTVINYVDFEFSEEFGPERGSWKGGVMSSSGIIDENNFSLHINTYNVLEDFCKRDKCTLILLSSKPMSFWQNHILELETLRAKNREIYPAETGVIET